MHVFPILLFSPNRLTFSSQKPKDNPLLLIISLDVFSAYYLFVFVAGLWRGQQQKQLCKGASLPPIIQSRKIFGRSGSYELVAHITGVIGFKLQP